MDINDLGYNKSIEKYRKDNNLESFGIGRVISEHKDRYTVKTIEKEFDSEIIGNLRFTAENRQDLPAVGDWVAISEYDENKALIHAVFPRKSILERKAVGKQGQSQIIAANIDYGLIVQSVNRDFNINRIERYLTICNSSKIEPIIVLSKIDLINSLEKEELLSQINKRIDSTPIFTISNVSNEGINKLKSQLIKGKTYCLLGSSGVGKSSIINSLSGEEMMETGEISKSIDRGKHITTHRELIVLENGILIDNPGIREVGITSENQGLEMTFDEISQLSMECKYNDCSHTVEKGCAVLEAIENEELDSESYDNYIKMRKEKSFFESSAQERKKKDKDLGKLIKKVKGQKNKNKF